MKNIDEVLAKVQKLLNVEGRTPEEAAVYVERAHAILAEYDLSIESVANLKADARTSIRRADGITSTTEGKPDGWKADVLEAVAAVFECRIVWTTEYKQPKPGQRYKAVRTGNLVGFGHDVEAAGYAHSFVVNEIVRLAKEYARGGWDAIRDLAARDGISLHDAESRYVKWHGNPHPLKSELYFTRGAAETVREALIQDVRRRKYEADIAANPNALVVQKEAAIKDYFKAEAAAKKGMSVEEYDAAIAKREAAYAADRERWAAESAARAAREAEERAKETPKQRERREAREAREEARENARYWREQERKENATDYSALYAGREAGRAIKVRPGITGEERGAVNG